MSDEPYRPSAEQLRQARESLRRILLENIVPFWASEALDDEDGGYRLNHDLQGRWRGKANKRLVKQARTLWFFSRLARSPYGTRSHLAAADHGYRFLRDRMWDQRWGGFFWEVDSAGSLPTMPDKHMYGQAFALYALSEYAAASEAPEALGLARRLFDLMEDRAYDPVNGGYSEFFRQDWGVPAPNVRGYLGVPPDIKMATTHLHLLEAITSYFRVTGDASLRQRVFGLILVNSSAVVRKRLGACTPAYESDWWPLRKTEFEYVSFGHDFKNVWLLAEACAALGLPDRPLLDLYRAHFDYAIRFGFDSEQAGFYERGPLDGLAQSREKLWWVQAEALLCALYLFHLTHEEQYFTCFLLTLDWIEHHQVDWVNGDWHAQIAESGAAFGDKAGIWKGPYHNGRAMLRCLELLPTPCGA